MTNGKKRTETSLLYCHLGHQLTCGSDLLCGGSGHGGMSDRIDVHQLFAEMIRRGQIDLNQVMELMMNPYDHGRIHDVCPPQHLRLRIFDLNPGDFPSDNNVSAAGIAYDGTIWVVSGFVPEGGSEVEDTIGLRLRIEGIVGDKRARKQFAGLTQEGNDAVARAECIGLFGPSFDIGAVCVTPRYFSYIAWDLDMENRFFVVRGRSAGLPVIEIIPFSSEAEIGLQNELDHESYFCLQGFLPTTEGPWSKSVGMMRDDLQESRERGDEGTEWVPAKLQLVRDEGDTLVSRLIPAYPRSPSGLLDWGFSWAIDDGGVSLVLNNCAGPVYDHIHAVRIFGKSPAPRKVVYVAQKGDAIYKVTVKL